jgi:hypothetical protein
MPLYRDTVTVGYSDYLRTYGVEPIVRFNEALLARGLWCLFMISPLIFLCNKLSVDYRYPSSLFLCAGMYMIVKASIQSRNSALLCMDSKSVVVWCMLVMWSVYTVARGITFDRFAIQIWGIRIYAWAWVVPVCMLLGVSLSSWIRVLRLVVTATMLGVPLWMLMRLLGKNTDLGLTSAAPLALVFGNYLPKISKLVLWLGAFACMYLYVLSSERNLLIGNGLLILMSLYIFALLPGHTRSLRILIVISAALLLAVLVYYVWVSDNIVGVNERAQVRIAEFKETLFENSRYGENHSLYRDFLTDVRGLDFLIGRGCQGTYLGFIGNEMGWKYRREIECGYFHIILKGGIVLLALILTLAVPAVYLGLIYSRNWFTRGCAIIVLVRLIEMAPFGLPSADPRYVIFWLAVGACLSPQLRGMSEYDMACSFSILRPPLMDDKGKRL